MLVSLYLSKLLSPAILESDHFMIPSQITRCGLL